MKSSGAPEVRSLLVKQIQVEQREKTRVWPVAPPSDSTATNHRSSWRTLVPMGATFPWLWQTQLTFKTCNSRSLTLSRITSRRPQDKLQSWRTRFTGENTQSARWTSYLHIGAVSHYRSISPDCLCMLAAFTRPLSKAREGDADTFLVLLPLPSPKQQQ